MLNGTTEISVEAKIIRKNGRVEDLGVISYYHRSWWRRLLFRLRRWLAWR